MKAKKCKCGSKGKLYHAYANIIGDGYIVLCKNWSCQVQGPFKKKKKKAIKAWNKFHK